MPKRRNPFGDCSPLQFKQHVGVKEVDMGVGQEQHMKSVFERTKELLFSGAKKGLDMPTMDANCNNIYPSEMLQIQCQTDIAMEDEPCTTNPAVSQAPPVSSSAQQQQQLPHMEAKPRNAFEALMKKRTEKQRSSCHCCSGQAASQNRCGFCEKSICRDCVRACTSCDGLFCQICSVMNPEEAFQQWYCQQCSYRLNPYIHWAQSF